MTGTDHRLVGLSFALVATSVPDWLLSVGDKLLIATVTAFFTGLAYKAGQAAWDRLRGRKQ